ncbi:MAG: FAD-dependent oxidoreductase [Coriobacteriales bacterium]|jgi:fumarate reductase flavoprotein subunit|nr:FAD-dependent oxidoreductase [Coriobacteriales bacterium]
MEEKKDKLTMDRRHFLTGIAGATAIGAAGTLIGCAPSTPEPAGTASSGSAGSGSGSGSAGAEDWLGAPPEIGAVAETIDGEVVIVGAGVAGLAAGLAAIENGVKPIIVEKGDTSRSGGGVHGAVNTKLQAQSGISFSEAEIDKLIKAEMKNSGMNADEMLLRVWAAESGTVLDTIIELTAADGVESRINTLPLPDYNQEEMEYFTEGAYPVGHAVGPGDANGPAIDALTKKIQSEGGEFYYGTAGVALIQDAEGNVTGVYGERGGEYLQFNASKGVVVTTGEYGNNPAMVEAFVPQVAGLGLNCFYAPPVNTGDGHKMMVWAGAEMQRAPHAPMTACTFLVPQPVPFLLVNINGERFQNEASSNFIAFNSVGHQPEMTAFQVFDSRWAEVSNNLKVMTWENTYLPDAEKVVSVEDASLTSDTLEGLAEQMGIPVAAFVETVNRRNALADAGHDDDFGLPIDRLIATKITDPPFYANQSNLIGYGVCLGGVWVNKNMEVLKPDGTPIGGLYAAGNTVGRRFGTSYFQELCGLSNGLADAHGYVAGRSAATKA